MQNELISVITVTYNCIDHIDKTLQSVENCKNKYSIEHIIVDGASSDGTWELVSSRRGSLAQAISEPDNGIYDAMNKGILLANGKYILFLNAGDIIYEDFDFSALNQTDSCNVKYFSYMIDGEGEFIHCPGINHPFGMQTSHQATLFDSCLLKKVGFDTSYKVAADFNQSIKLNKLSSVKHSYDTQVLAIVQPGGYSMLHKEIMLNEYSEIIKREFGFFRWFVYKIWSSRYYNAIKSLLPMNSIKRLFNENITHKSV